MANERVAEAAGPPVNVIDDLLLHDYLQQLLRESLAPEVVAFYLLRHCKAARARARSAQPKSAPAPRVKAKPHMQTQPRGQTHSFNVPRIACFVSVEDLFSHLIELRRQGRAMKVSPHRSSSRAASQRLGSSPTAALSVASGQSKDEEAVRKWKERVASEQRAMAERRMKWFLDALEGTLACCT